MTRSWLNTVARGGKRGAGMQERPVQRGAIRLLAMQRIEAVAVPNGAHLAGDKLSRAKQMQALRKDGLRPGFPDLILFGRQRQQIGFIEVKREIGNDLSEDQEGWRDMLIGWGFPWAMIRQSEEALAVVRAWGWIR
ncbi:VRR-NUC domain-containing protein [Sphingobium sp. WCS2017Hpa-17]|uniref:VRR-NUC domain-containing protein n=1 Tax=Sphingobium sp. WCS2017Hpa-17 TaxID=3073638 RepID=UPI00288ABA64|nr:VRR-NUC domain-containing protein [Sphingobium sp. WCS2017Hpa-17]